MKKHFLIVVGLVSFSLVFAADNKAKGPSELSHDQILELVGNINNELMVKDIPALEDKIVVLDLEGNIILEEKWADLEAKNSSSEERKMINKSSFLMEYAGDSYYILEK